MNRAPGNLGSGDRSRGGIAPRRFRSLRAEERPPVRTQQGAVQALAACMAEESL